ncbi:MAG: iron ABC transporter permease [Gemmatimonadota bacterium]|nr:iron ABC transporter permease [Gemmatimonadota bacterium]
MEIILPRNWRLAVRSLPWGWTAVALALVLLLAIPVITIPIGALAPAGEAWEHVSTTLLPRYMGNTLFLVLASGGIALGLGAGTAWLVAVCEFPGRKLFRWALVLPLAVPAYMAAYVYAGMVGVTGPIQRTLRAVVPGASDTIFYWNIMRIEVVAVLFGLVLFPYVYLPVRALLESRAGPTLEAARVLGRGHASVFWTIGLPLARPALAGGVALVLMEVINDYGAVKYFGVPTFTTGIFRAWFSLGDLDSAVRLSGILMLIVLTLLLIERWQRGQARYAASGDSSQPAPYLLHGAKGLAATLFCALPIAFGFLIPVLQLAAWTVRTAPDVVDGGFIRMTANSLGLAGLAGLIAVTVALVLSYTSRLDRTEITRSASRIALLGYSVPGAVIAVGVLTVSLFLDGLLGGGVRLILTGTAAALVAAYVVRFLAVAYLPVEAGLERVGTNLTEASRMLGARPLRTLLRIEVPLLRGTLVAAGTLVVIDVLKELPLTLILRPFNFDTLATRAFQLASDEQIAESAPAALLVILCATVVVAFLHRTLDEREDFGR